MDDGYSTGAYDYEVLSIGPGVVAVCVVLMLCSYIDGSTG